MCLFYSLPSSHSFSPPPHMENVWAFAICIHLPFNRRTANWKNYAAFLSIERTLPACLPSSLMEAQPFLMKPIEPNVKKTLLENCMKQTVKQFINLLNMKPFTVQLAWIDKFGYGRSTFLQINNLYCIKKTVLSCLISEPAFLKHSHLFLAIIALLLLAHLV